jgi:hypothetical protein
MDDDLKLFIKSVDDTYQGELDKLTLFSAEAPFLASKPLQQKFIKLFYHIRGHFHEFLWYLLNHAPALHWKELILENILEESGRDLLSHEELYAQFAREFDVDIANEMLHQSHYALFIREFNSSHLKWLASHNWQHGFAAYSAYERLDNIDYQRLYNLAELMGTSEKGLTFFTVHKHVQHYETTQQDLHNIWQTDPNAVKSAYQFIYGSQLKVWQQLACVLESETVGVN